MVTPVKILTSAPSLSWPASVWRMPNAAIFRQSMCANANRASKETVRWNAEILMSVERPTPAEPTLCVTTFLETTPAHVKMAMLEILTQGALI